MAAGIEHRDIDGILNCYQDYGEPNFSIWNGKRLCVQYAGDNTDEGTQTLLSFLNQIKNSQTQSVYLLKVHEEGIKKITNSSDYSGSTTFMLSPTAMTTTGQNGVMIIDQGSKTQQYSSVSGSKDITSRLDKLEAENIRLREELHKTELAQLRTEFENKISGLANQEKELTGWDKLMAILDKHGDKIEKVLDKTIDKVATVFTKGGTNDYIVTTVPGGGSVSGTTHTEPANSEEMETDTELPLTAEGALINPLLNEEERKLSQPDQDKILKAKLDGLDQQQHDDLQTGCLEILEKRISAPVLSRMLLVVAGLSNKDLNKLLNHLD